MLDLWSFYYRRIREARAQLKLLGACRHVMLRREYGPELEGFVNAAANILDRADLMLFANYVAETKLEPVRPDLDAMLAAVADDLTSAGCFDTARNAQHLRQVLRLELEIKAEADAARRARAA